MLRQPAGQTGGQTGGKWRVKPIRRRHLPSLGALATFEVAAKHLSFTLAARELNITQGAVSQQIRLLERALDTALFIRRHNALDLTAAGADLYAAVAAGLDRISAGVGLLQPEAAPQAVTVSATDALAALWLKPLIDSFRADHPAACFTVLASDEDAGLSQHALVDIALLCGNERFDIGDELHLMYPEVAQPVCSPACLAAHGPFADAESLTRAPLLHLHERHWSAGAIQWHPLGWEEWFAAQGVPYRNAGVGLSTNKVTLLTEAAVAGEGVMLGIDNLVRGHIRSGALVFAHPARIASGRSNFMKVNPVARARPLVARFADHLLQALRSH